MHSVAEHVVVWKYNAEVRISSHVSTAIMRVRCSLCGKQNVASNNARALRIKKTNNTKMLDLSGTYHTYDLDTYRT